jgi:hypothetical protein
VVEGLAAGISPKPVEVSSMGRGGERGRGVRLGRLSCGLAREVGPSWRFKWVQTKIQMISN